ncbi:hypothetical protein AWB79_06123 [Caballeronia hypogeia]|uniref:Proteophosphoglycan ppg4 n=1 Tax=Caballeronia hypogeia TaxID=1777140 RepID=A0A158CWS5_9BURK|nr:hypothetical protein [Caballeronia hypogeia]SAK86815.1 hypothetical protein AWB79_06123 [Caballeronia hypogeia]
MSKAISTLIAAVAALTLSGGAFAQAAGGGTSGAGSTGSTASPANQVNGATGGTGGYGTPGVTHSDSGMSAKPNSGLPSSTNSGTSDNSAPQSNNTLATPSVKSPAAQ